MIALVGLNANAAMYIVGDAPFGGWNPGAGVEMTNNGDGTYSYTVQINGQVGFVFGDGLNSNWGTFNTNHRYGPANGNTTIQAGNWISTSKAGDHGCYYFSGTGDNYVFTFDVTNKRFKVEGEVAPITETYTVCGSDSTLFGDDWDPSIVANDMTLDETDGLYKLVKNDVVMSAGTLYYKVAKNHGWAESWGNPEGPDGNQDYVFPENGTYDLTFKFNFDTKEVSLDAVLKQAGPAIDPLTGHLYIVGNVNGNGWNPANAIEMETLGDDDTFTITNAEITAATDNEFGFFSFMAIRGTENNYPADGYRIGAPEDGTIPVLDQFVDMGGFGSTGAFKLEPGFYNMTVVLSSGENGQIKVTKVNAPEPVIDDVYILGDVNNIGWNATDGVKMTYNEGIYTANITTQNQGDLGIAYFGFTKKLAETNDSIGWASITPFRFGPVSEDAFVMTKELLGTNCALATDGSYNSIAIPAGTWTVTVDLVNNTFAIAGEWPTVEPEHYDGDVYILGEVNDNGGWFPNVGVKMTRDAENNLYTATITTAGENIPEGEEVGYSYFSFTKKLAENDSENGGWGEINNGSDRFGAVTDGNPFLVTEELLGQNLSLQYAAEPNAFKIPAGNWNLTLSVDNKTLVITKVEAIRGDVNNDKNVTIADVTALIDYLLSGSSEGVNTDAANCNLDEGITIADVTSLIDYLLSGNW